MMTYREIEMPVVMMIEKSKAFDESGALRPDVQIVRDYHGHEEGVHHRGTSCPHNGYDGRTNALTGEFILGADGRPEKLDSSGSACIVFGPLYMETTYKGCVLETREYNGRDDSDFYALCWDEATQSIAKVNYATTRGWTYPNGASEDATEDVRQKASAWIRKIVKAQWVASNRAQAEKPAVGKRVELVRNVTTKGVKYEKGLVGEVSWAGMGQKFSRWDVPELRVCVSLHDGRSFYTKATAVRVLDPECYLKSDSEGDRSARQSETCWVLPFSVSSVPTFV